MTVEKLIPMLDTTSEIDELWTEINSAIQRVLRSGEFIMGSDVKLLEAELAEFLGVKHAIGLNSGTDALFIGLKALGIGEGDEVITTPFTFFATAEAISLVGAKPVFVDIDPGTFNINPERIAAAVSSRTKAIIPVHLYGNPAPMAPIMRIASQYGLKVLEDCAQSFGARYLLKNDQSGSKPVFSGNFTGSIGDAGAFSFFPSKNLGAYGDGGLLVTNDDQVADIAKMLRAHGSKKKYHNEIIGYNSRLDTLQAAILRVKLPHITRYNENRRNVAQTYNNLLVGVRDVITPHISDGHVFHQYTIRVLDGKRDWLQRELSHRNISTMIYYPIPVHKLPVYADMNQSFPITEQIALEVLSLPIWPRISEETQRLVTHAIRSLLDESN